MQTEPGRRAPHELDVAALRSRARTHVPAGPARVTEPPGPAPAPTRRRPTTLAAGLAGVAGLVLGGLWVGVGRGGDGHAGALAVQPRAASVDWAGVLAELDRRRSRAFAEVDSAALGAVYAPASAALAQDRARIAALKARGLRGEGLHLRIDRVAVRAAAPGAVDLAVVDRLDGYALTDRSGAVRARAPGRGAASWGVRLVPAPDRAGGWLIAALERRPPVAAGDLRPDHKDVP